MDDVIRLINVTEGDDRDEYGNPEIIRTSTEVFCRVDSVTRAEFYQASQMGLHPSYTFVLSHYMDYHGEQECEYTDWTGTHRYDIIRTYRRDTDELEIVTQERINE